MFDVVPSSYTTYLCTLFYNIIIIIITMIYTTAVLKNKPVTTIRIARNKLKSSHVLLHRRDYLQLLQNIKYYTTFKCVILLCTLIYCLCVRGRKKRFDWCVGTATRIRMTNLIALERIVPIKIYYHLDLESAVV